MSGIGISPADIVKAIQIVHWIYRNCFKEANKAHNKYREFGRLILGYEGVLEALSTSVNNVAIALGQSHDDLASAAGIRQQYKDASAEYEAIFRDCKKLLTTHKTLERNAAGIIVNVRWNADIQGDVAALEKRIANNTPKVQLLIGQLLITQQNAQHDLQRASSELDPASVPPAVADRFRAALTAGLDDRDTTLRHLQQEEKLEALQLHWYASTFQTPPDSEISIHQYLELLKTVWLIIELRSDHAFKYGPLGFPYRMTIQNIQRSVSQELERPELQDLQRSDLLTLDDDAYDILPREEPIDSGVLPDERPWEKKLLELPLPDAPGCVRHSLLVYRTGPASLRFVREKVARDTNAISRESESISIFSDLLLPYYAASPDGQNLNMVLRNRTGTGKTPYVLKEEKDVFALQRAVTGYKVMSDRRSMSWYAHRSNFGIKSGLKGSGRIQIWRLDPLQAEQEDNERLDRQQSVAMSADNTSGGASQTSQTTNSTFANITRGMPSSIADSSVITVTDSNVVATGNVPLPIVVIFTKTEKDYFEYVAVDMEQGIEKQINQCNCGSHPTRCLRTVYRKPNGGIQMRRFMTEFSNVEGPSLDKWNLAVFSRVSIHNTEQHPDTKSKAYQEVKAEFLSFDFATVEDRFKFDTHFRAVARLRDQDLLEAHAFINRARYLSHRPKEARRSSGASTQRNSVIAGMPTPTSTVRAAQTWGTTTETSTTSNATALPRNDSHQRAASSAPKLPGFNFSPAIDARQTYFTQ